jgi:hypothetical protein
MAASGPPPDLDALARDWATLWQSELAALATDREARESWQAGLRLWAGAVSAMLAAVPQSAPVPGQPSHDQPAGARPSNEQPSNEQPPLVPREQPSGRARATAPPGAASVAAAPDPRDAEIERLGRRVLELESRLAELEHGVRRGDGSHRRGAAGSRPRRQRS